MNLFCTDCQVLIKALKYSYIVSFIHKPSHMLLKFNRFSYEVLQVSEKKIIGKF